jgi:hypothetical protein
MRRSLLVLFASGLLFLLTGCEVWLFLDDDDGNRSGIDVYADISTIATLANTCTPNCG